MTRLERRCGERDWRSAVRGAIGCLVGLFVVMQGVASIGSSVDHRRFHDRPSTVSALVSAARTCTAGSDRHEPSRGDHHAQCCVLCAQRDHVGDSFAAPSPDWRYPPPRAIVTTAHHSLWAARPIIAGWASSWSSRAPPAFS